MLISMIIKKLLSLVVAFLTAVSLLTPPSTEEPIQVQNPDECVASFAVMSDVHHMDEAFSESRLEMGLSDLESAADELDALILPGDLTNNGLKDEFESMFELLEKQTAVKSVLLSTGNHDARFFYNRNNSLYMAEVEKLLGLELNSKPYYSYSINGVRFIVLGTEKQVFERAYLSEQQLEFLDSELDAAQSENMPAIVVNHQPLKDTHGLPEVWSRGDVGEQSDALRQVLCSHKNVVYLTGHLHDGNADKRLEEFSDGVYGFCSPAFGKINDFDLKQRGYGAVFEIYSDKIIIRIRNFLTGEYAAAQYCIDLI